MIWIAPSEKNTATDMLEKRLWDAAGKFRADPSPILSLTCLRLADAINLAKRIQNLRRTRDLLLPRLLSEQVNL
jgi:hypothetical protein